MELKTVELCRAFNLEIFNACSGIWNLGFALATGNENSKSRGGELSDMSIRQIPFFEQMLGVVGFEARHSRYADKIKLFA